MQTAIETGRDLDTVLEQLSDGLTSTAADQAIATAEFRLVDTAVSEAVGSLRDYIDVMGDVQGEFETTDAISDRLTQSIRDQASAFDDLRDAAVTTGVDITDALDMLDTEIQPVGREITDLELALQSVGDNSGTVLDQLIGDFSNLDGVVGELGTKIGQFDIAGACKRKPKRPRDRYPSNSTMHLPLTSDKPMHNSLNSIAKIEHHLREANFGIPSDLLGLGRGQLDTAALATGASGFGGRPLLDLLEGLEPQIGRTSLDAVATIPDRIIETIQSFTDFIIEGLTDELSQATFDLNFAQQDGGRC